MHVKGCELAQKALDKFCPLLGNKHPDILETKVALARNMTKGGDFSERKKLFREVVSVKSNIRGSTKAHGLSNSSYGLARVLIIRGCYNNALKCYLAVVRARAAAYG